MTAAAARPLAVDTEPSAFQVMPVLTADEMVALETSIKETGILVPVVVDQHGRTLDGHHRREIAARLGIDCPTEVRHVRDDDEARDLALSLNLARRHLTREQRRDLIRREIEARPQDSDRAIARRFGCDHKTVGAVRRPGGEVPHNPERQPAPSSRSGATTWSRRVQAVSAKVPMDDLTDDEVKELHGAATFLRDYCQGELEIRTERT